MMLKTIAINQLATEKLSISASAINTTAPFTTSANSPSVRIVAGKANSCNIGASIVLRSPNTIATIKLACSEVTAIYSSYCEKIKTLFTTILTMGFIIAWQF